MGKGLTVNPEAPVPAEKAERVDELQQHLRKGKRAQGKGTYPPDGQVRMSQNVPRELYEAFKMQATLEASTIRALLVRAMREYLQRKKQEGAIDLTPTGQYELPIGSAESLEEAMPIRRRVDFESMPHRTGR